MDKHPLEGLLSAIVEGIKSQSEGDGNKVVVGTATEAQVARLQAIRHRKEDLETEVERLMDTFTTKLERDYKPKHDKLNQEQKNAWREIEDANGLGHNGKYGLNYGSLEVYEHVRLKEKNRNEGLKH